MAGKDSSGLSMEMFGQTWYAPWDPEASWDPIDTISIYGSAAAVAGTASGAAAGATTGAATGAVIGGVAGALGGAGVGALPGAAAGATSGAVAGGISNAITGLISSAFAGNVQNAAINGAIVGGISGVLAGAGSGAGYGAGGSQPLTHYTSQNSANLISAGFGGQGQLGVNAASSLYATTGSVSTTMVGGSVVGIPISGPAASLFTAPTIIGPFTAYQSAAGFMVGPAGVINLTTGSISVGGGVNTVAAGWAGIDFFIHILIGVGCSKVVKV